MLFAIAAPSGAGKTSIVKAMLKLFPDLVFSVSVTTREKRDKEINGKDYFFITKDEFLEKIKKNELVEYEILFDNNYYGTLKSYVDENLNKNINVIFDIDVNGAISLKRIYNGDVILIFIKPPSKEIVEQRLRDRGTETVEQIKKRMIRYDSEIGLMNEFNFIVENSNLESAISQVKEIIIKYKI